MILIGDYRNLRSYGMPDRVCGAAEYMGKDVTITTTAGTVYSGVIVENNEQTLALVIRRRSDRTDKRVVVSKLHIVAIETALE